MWEDEVRRRANEALTWRRCVRPRLQGLREAKVTRIGFLVLPVSRCLVGDRVVGLDSRTIKRGCRMRSSDVIGCQVLKSCLVRLVLWLCLSRSVRPSSRSVRLDRRVCLFAKITYHVSLVFKQIGVSDLEVGVSDMIREFDICEDRLFCSPGGI
jgi:hypothetical protein